ncbi:MAG: GAF domain-containing protein [Mesorhizobium sp.]|nr:MAG: GAF domain-containing protein [Mesorhizobium sp.]
MNEASDEKAPHRPWHGLAARAMMGLVALALMVGTISVIAVQSFNELRQSFDSVADVQIKAIETAAELRQRAEAITRLAPSLYAKGLEQDALLNFSLLSFKEQSKLQELTGKLKSQTNKDLSELEETTAELFRNLDTLATTLYDRAATEDALDGLLQRIFRIAVSGKAESALAQHGAVTNEVTATALGLATAGSAEELQTTANELQPRISLLAAADPDLARQFEEALLGARGVVELKGRLFRLFDDIRGQLADNELFSGKLVAAADVISQETARDVDHQGNELDGRLTARARVLSSIAVLAVVGAIFIAGYLQTSVVGRIRKLSLAMRETSPPANLKALTRGNDEVSDLARAFVHYAQEINQRVKELAILNSVGEAMAKTLNVKTVTRIVGDKLREIFGTEVTEILLRDEKSDLITVPYAFCKGYRQPEPFAMGEGLTSTVIRSREPLVVGSIDRLLELGALMPTEEDRTESYLGVPIIAGDRTLGVVSVQSYQKNAFNEAHVRLLQGLSTSMGVAIANARLFDETQRLLKETEDRAAELAILNSVSESMAKSLNLETIVRLVGDKVREIFGTEVTEILLHDSTSDMIYVPYAYYSEYRVMDVPERPVVKTMAVQVSDGAGGVDVVTGRSNKTRVHDTHIDRSFMGGCILGQQTFRCLGAREAQSMEHDVKTAGRLKHGLGTTTEDRYRVRKHELFRYPRQGVMISADLENPDTGLVEACHLRCQKPRGFHRSLIAIIKIAGNDKRVDTLSKAEIHNGDKRLATGVSDEFGQIGVPQRERTEWRVEMNIGRM